jgi:predicted secreted protein
MSQAFSGYGLYVELGNNDGSTSPFVAETFSAISEVQMVDFTGSKVDLVDVTHAQSPNARREYIATLIDDGEMTFTANFIPGDLTQTGLQTVYSNRAVRDWRVLLPGATSPSTVGPLGEFTFSGIVTSIDHGLPFDKEAKLSVKVKITGQLLFTP